jgi:hypothetical protein
MVASTKIDVGFLLEIKHNKKSNIIKECSNRP